MGSVHNGRLPAAGAPGVGYPYGHFGHLEEHEAKALEDFKILLEEKGEYTPGPPPTTTTPSCCTRFLRARRWVPQDAYTQFSENESFRKANQIDVLYDTMDVDAYEKSKTLYPRYTGRRDKRGMPVYVYRISHLDSKAVAAYEKDTQSTYSMAETDGKTPAKLLRLVALYEDLTSFVQPLCTQCPDREHAPTPITLSTNVVDISNVSLKMFWNLRQHMQAASELATSHYPETLDRIFIIGAPYFFSTVWGWIKKWFDPVTVSKIFILTPAEVIPVLSQFIEMRDIPKVYGGELAWEFFDEPAWDEGIMKTCKWENGHTAFPVGPKRWELTEDGKHLQCIAVGYKDGQPRRELVCKVAVLNSAVETTEQTTATEDAPVVAEDAPVAATPAVAATESATTTTAPVDEKTPGTVKVAGMAITVKGEEVYKGDHLTTAPVDEVEALKLTDDEVNALKEKKEDAAVPTAA
ncbi:CRAL-TRIO domain-containing protein [Microdochium trichocladiopsis]|uniref:CRAL-TRIO domain-containing protein n=1 Tax=Microdochium trichocladiopsis TaxID=1682393 RepID=A0A9P8YEQ3_9PEZI|nr:CRAL-TRIO domain-containing protein [Microdochium trichocladiopsis]KAH7035622.1 CRAL-TRIO domain-containing protein [Microdochium trichocladiopsis]